MSGLIGKKIGMTSIYDASGKNIPCTVIEAGPCVVTQVRTIEKDGYEAIQLAFDEKKEKHTTKALSGHFKKAGTTPKKVVAEFTRFEVGHQKKFGDILNADIFMIRVRQRFEDDSYRAIRHRFKSPAGRDARCKVRSERRFRRRSSSSDPVRRRTPEVPTWSPTGAMYRRMAAPSRPRHGRAP